MNKKMHYIANNMKRFWLHIIFSIAFLGAISDVFADTKSYEKVEYWSKGAKDINKPLKVGKYTYSETAANHVTDTVKKQGWNHGKLNRPYMNSPHAIEEVIKTGKGVPDQFIKGALRYDVPGVFREQKGIWELVIDPKNDKIYHFLFNPKK